MAKIKFIIIALMLILTAGCFNQYQGEDFFFVKNDGADMPVWVKGNMESNTVILFLHGGPGDTSFIYSYMDAFKNLEKNYAVAYYDQRGSGNSQGNIDVKKITVDKFVEDTDRIVDVIKIKYKNPKIFLMGHSWGGGLGTAYLLDKERQKKISGWIEMDGSHNEKLGGKISREKIIEYAKNQIGANTDKAYWEEALKWYDENKEINFKNGMTHTGYVRKAKGYYYNKEGLDKYMEKNISNIIFNSPTSFFAYAMNALNIIEAFDFYQIDFTKEMANITIPALILWGKADLAIPVELADNAEASLGTPQADKFKVIFDKSGHTPCYEEPEKFYDEVTKFVNKYR